MDSLRLEIGYYTPDSKKSKLLKHSSFQITDVEWNSVRLPGQTTEEVSELKQQSGKDVLVGSRGLILQLIET